MITLAIIPSFFMGLVFKELALTNQNCPIAGQETQYYGASCHSCVYPEDHASYPLPKSVGTEVELISNNMMTAVYDHNGMSIVGKGACVEVITGYGVQTSYRNASGECKAPTYSQSDYFYCKNEVDLKWYGSLNTIVMQPPDTIYAEGERWMNYLIDHKAMIMIPYMTKVYSNREAKIATVIIDENFGEDAKDVNTTTFDLAPGFSVLHDVEYPNSFSPSETNPYDDTAETNSIYQNDIDSQPDVKDNDPVASSPKRKSKFYTRARKGVVRAGKVSLVTAFVAKVVRNRIFINMAYEFAAQVSAAFEAIKVAIEQLAQAISENQKLEQGHRDFVDSTQKKLGEGIDRNIFIMQETKSLLTYSHEMYKLYFGKTNNFTVVLGENPSFSWNVGSYWTATPFAKADSAAVDDPNPTGTTSKDETVAMPSLVTAFISMVLVFAIFLFNIFASYREWRTGFEPFQKLIIDKMMNTSVTELALLATSLGTVISYYM